LLPAFVYGNLGRQPRPMPIGKITLLELKAREPPGSAQGVEWKRMSQLGHPAQTLSNS
jgi:hypothetical protein